jgi:parallel beta-helix repeat protein
VLLEGPAAGSEKEGGAIELYRCRETTLSGCQVFEPTYRGVYVADCRKTRVADCTVLDRTGAGTMRAAIEVTGQSPGTVLRGNLVGKGSHGDLIAPGAVVEGNRVGA